MGYEQGENVIYRSYLGEESPMEHFFNALNKHMHFIETDNEAIISLVVLDKRGPSHYTTEQRSARVTESSTAISRRFFKYML